MIVHREYAQGDPEWIEAHCGIPTASEFKNLVTDKGEIRKWSSQMPNTYLHRKLAEKWGGPLPGFTAYATEQGHFLEEKAIPIYEYEHRVKIDRVAFCTTDDGRIGCSPDGLIEPDGGIEIKSLELPHHIEVLLDGVLPVDYWAQVHGCMLVTGRPWWVFYAFRLNFPKLRVVVERDDAIQETLSDALGEFLQRFDAKWERLVAMHGRPPPRRQPMVFADDIAAGRAKEPDDLPH